MKCKNMMVSAVLWAFLVVSHAAAQQGAIKNSGELEIALQKLGTLGSVLYIGAHPDDENTAALAYFSKGKKYRAAYLSVTRGDGGQNLIGPEKGVEIGIIRTQELLEARNIDGAEQYFTRAIDFGYSKTPEETFNFWDREKILSDMVWIIRNYRPDIMITRFPPGQSGGHGHHTASTALALDAFRAAADPTQFPEQLTLVKTWKTKRFFANSFRSGQQGDVIRVNVGEYSPLLGKSYTEISALSRSMHKTQGFGSAGRRGVQYDNFELVEGEPARGGLFEGIDATWNRMPGGGRIGEMLQAIQNTFDLRDPSKSIPRLLAVYKEMNTLPEDGWVAVKRRELREVIQSCAGLWIEASADGFSAAPGDSIPFRITVVNRSAQPFVLEKAACPECGYICEGKRELEDNAPSAISGTLRIPAAKAISQPYWLEAPFSEGMFTVSDQRMIGAAENAPAICFLISLNCGGISLEYPAPLTFRWTDRAEGELTRPFEIRPPATVNFEENVCVFGNRGPKTIAVRVKGNIPRAAGTVRLSGPKAWKIEPPAAPFSIEEKYGEQRIVFTVSPPPDAGQAILNADIETGGKHYDRALVEIAHPHMKNQIYFPKSVLKTVKLENGYHGGAIGYIMGSGDEVPEALRSLGCDVTLLDDQALTTGNLASFQTIITGVRAYNTRGILRHVQPRLLEYVRNGGTLIVQYNTPSGLLINSIGPYPFTLGNDRVCVETAPVSFIKPDHPLLRIPNRITAADFEGWTQERGLYFASQWDERYEPILSSHDPNESGRTGGMLYARYGNGIFIYSSYAWFRQLPSGVPGAYRLFLNMISAGKK